MLVGDFSKAPQIAARRHVNTAFPLDGFDNNGGGGLVYRGLGSFTTPKFDKLHSRQQRFKRGSIPSLTGDGCRSKRSAMEAVQTGNDPRPLFGTTDQFQRAFCRFGTTTRKEDFREPLRGNAHE